MKKISISIYLFGLVAGCYGQHDQKTVEANFFYNSISAQITANRPLQQKVIDELKQVLQRIKDDSTAVIDTAALSLLIDSAHTRNYQRQLNIERIREVDSSLNYKAAILSYIRLFNSFYDNELKTLLGMITRPQAGRFARCGELLKPKLILIFEKDKELANLKKEFKSKYAINTDGTVLTTADYEMVKLSDFRYSEAKIEEGQEVSLMSYSGFKMCKGDTTYFMQFIAVVKATGDTIRILSACQPYDVAHPVRVGYFTKRDVPKTISAERSFIVFNRTNSRLERRTYPTIIGALGFPIKMN